MNETVVLYKEHYLFIRVLLSIFEYRHSHILENRFKVVIKSIQYQSK